MGKRNGDEEIEDLEPKEPKGKGPNTDDHPQDEEED